MSPGAAGRSPGGLVTGGTKGIGAGVQSQLACVPMIWPRTAWRIWWRFGLAVRRIDDRRRPRSGARAVPESC